MRDGLEFLTIRAAAKLIGVPERAMHGERLKGRLTVYLVGKCYYTTPADLDAWRERCRVQTPAPASSSGVTAASTSAGTSTEGDASVRRAQKTLRELNKRYADSSTRNASQQCPPAPVIPMK